MHRYLAIAYIKLLTFESLYSPVITIRTVLQQVIGMHQLSFKYQCQYIFPYSLLLLSKGGLSFQNSKEPVSPQGIFIYGSRDTKSRLERQEMDRILNSGRLCNARCPLQVANIRHVLARAQAEISAWGHICLSEGDKAHMANNFIFALLPIQKRVISGCIWYNQPAHVKGIPFTASEMRTTCSWMILYSKINIIQKILYLGKLRIVDNGSLSLFTSF